MSIHIFSFVANIFVEIIISICNDKHFEGNWHKERFLIVLMLLFSNMFFFQKSSFISSMFIPSFTRNRLSALQRFTTETSRTFFRRRTKQLPLARKENVLGHVAKRTWAYSFALYSSVFPSRFFSVGDLWLSLLIQHDKDNVYRLCFQTPTPCDFWLQCFRSVKECDDVCLPIWRHS